MDDQLREVVLATTEEMLAAQLRAVRALRRREAGSKAPRRPGMSQVDMAIAILREARQPLHVRQIIERTASQYGVTVARESLVSALTKRRVRDSRLRRVGPNLFAMREEEGADADREA